MMIIGNGRLITRISGKIHIWKTAPYVLKAG